MSLEIPLEAKETFYRQLHDLDASLPDDEDQYLQDDHRNKSRAFFQQAKKPGKQPTKPRQTKVTTASATGRVSTPPPNTPARSGPMTATPTATIQGTPLVPDAHSRADQQQQIPTGTSFEQDTPLQEPPSAAAAAAAAAVADVSTGDQGVTRTPTAAGTTCEQSPRLSSSIMASKSGRKRPVRGKGKNDVPEEKRILRNLRLFYIPPDRISLRKHRIEHAEKYGATVTGQLGEATHVVVDKNLKYEDIKDIVLPATGKNGITLVTEEWPLDCIQQGRVLPPYLKYRVKGMPSERPGSTGRDTEQRDTTRSPDRSLELKRPHRNPKRWDYVPAMTPSQSTASPLPILGQREYAQAAQTTRPPDQQAAGNHDDLPTSKGITTGGGTPGDAVELQGPVRPREEGSGPRDELSQIIDEARKEFKDVPRIGDEDANLSPNDDDGDDESGAEGGPKKKRSKKGRDKDTPRKYDEYYACNRGGTRDQAENEDNPNALTISVFRKMLDYYTKTNDHWRVLAYRRIINTLSMVKDRTITTAEEARKLPFFGGRLSAKLEEIVKTQTLQRLQFALNDPMSQVKALFLGVYGAGPTTADNWIAQGFRTLDDLLRSADLSYSQRIGIEHYEDIASRIPRAEVTKLGEYVKAEAVKIDKDVELLIGGSYRRGATSSGDIDLIITKKGTTSSRDLTPFLDKLVGSLSRQGFLTAELAAHSSTRDGSGSKWHGCCVLPRGTGGDGKEGDSYRPVWRRIDLLLVPETEYGAALIYFTGNDIFNRSIRLLASKRQMRLNQRGLYKDVLRGQNRQKISDGELLEGRDEKRIFQLLGVKWREPHERWC